MNEKQYLREVNKVLKHYDKVVKSYQNLNGLSLLLILQEKNDVLLRLTQHYHSK